MNDTENTQDGTEGNEQDAQTDTTATNQQTQQNTPAGNIELDVDAIAQQVRERVGTDRLAEEVSERVKANLRNVLGGQEDGKPNPLHKEFIRDPQALFRAAIDQAKQEITAEHAEQTEDDRKALRVYNDLAGDYPDLNKFNGEIGSDYMRIQKENPDLPRSEILKKSLPKTIERLKSNGVIKKVSPEEAAARNAQLPPARGAGGPPPENEYDRDKSAAEFIKNRLGQARGFRVASS